VLKKTGIAALAVVVLVLAGGFLWARAVLTGDNVRAALAAQLSKALGQPVSIGRLGASAFPRVTVTLGDVKIGDPVRLQLANLRIATNVRALLSRRIEHATLRLDGARIELPLPPLAGGASNAHAANAPVELVSIDEIVLRDVQLVSGGRTLRGNVELVPQGRGFALRNTSLSADGTTVTATGTITDVSAPAATIDVKASALDLDQLLAFASAVSSGSGSTGARAAPRSGTSRPDVTVTLEAARATLGTLALSQLSGKAHVTSEVVALNPIGFGLFGGRYDGALTLTTAGHGATTFRTAATLTNVDVAAATSWAGHPDTISGRLSGRLDCTGRGIDAATAVRTARGTARVEITNGVVKNLGLVHAVVVATSMRAGASGQLAGGSTDEPFSRLGATLNIGGGELTTDDLRFESNDLVLDAHGAVQLAAATLDLQGRVQLSDQLSQQAGRDLVRYTQEQGRVTLPATVTGPLSSPRVAIDVAGLARRAITNAAAEELEKRLKAGALKKGLSDLFKR
jgi:uncharacterized protein involved in outer membrane biogenesis